MTSVPRKIHMPRLEASFCCSSVAKWWSRAGLWVSWGDEVETTVWLSDNLRLLRITPVDLLVVVGFPGHDRLLWEVERGRRRLHRPFQTGGPPPGYGRARCRKHTTTAKQ